MKRAQNRIAESRFSLPITALACLVVIAAGELLHSDFWLNIAIITVSTLLMINLNNANALIRIYSRMVSCSFLVLCMSACLVTFKLNAIGAQLCFILFLVLLFHTYQDKHAPGIMFYTYSVLGVASIFYVDILYFVPLFWLLTATKLQAGSLRNWIASLLGLMAPYWFVFGYFVYKGDANALDTTLNHFTEIYNFQPLFDYSAVTVQQTITLSFFVLLYVIGTIHFLRNSYKDKIKTRMMFEIFMIINLFALIFIVLQPTHYQFLICMMIACISPLIGHFIALTNTKLTNIAFFIIIAAALIIAALNIWMPSLIYS